VVLLLLLGPCSVAAKGVLGEAGAELLLLLLLLLLVRILGSVVGTARIALLLLVAAAAVLAVLLVTGTSSPASESLQLLRQLQLVLLASEAAAQGPSYDSLGVPGCVPDWLDAAGLEVTRSLLLLLLHLERSV
jgi:hypothetical protein